MKWYLNRRGWLATTIAGGAAWYAGPLLRAATGSENSEMILIPAGPFLMGTKASDAEALAREYRCHVSWLGGEVPQRTVEVRTFRIDKDPVTNRRYAAFVQATGHKPPPYWQGTEPPAALLEHPVTYVNRADADLYAKWAGKRLPTATEWEKAARGTDGRLFPWGNQFDSEACQYDAGGVRPPTGTAPVTAHPRGASPYGVMDLAGNAAEWCADNPGRGSAFIKGGCWLSTSPLTLCCAARGMSGSDNNQLDYIGFRCAKEA
jgi:formylglycine-generating enzyme required for sulfatase activity